MPLSNKEKNELEILDNPEVQFLSSSIGGIFGELFSGDGITSRKKRLVFL